MATCDRIQFPHAWVPEMTWPNLARAYEACRRCTHDDPAFLTDNEESQTSNRIIEVSEERFRVKGRAVG